MAADARLTTRLVQLQDAYFAVVKALAAGTITAIFAVTILQVFYRYFLNWPIVWGEEFCRSLLIWMCFLFAGAAFQRGEMVAVEMLTRSLAPRLRALVLVPAYLATVGFLAVIVWHGWRYARQNLIQTMPGIDALWLSVSGDDAGVSIFWLYLSIPVGAGLLAIHLLLTAARLAYDAFAPQTGGRSP